MKIIICGSMKFSSDMLIAKADLESRGHEVTVPQGMELFLTGEIDSETADTKIANDYIRYYYDKISAGDAILVLNKTKNDVEHYIGGNTLMELGFAHVNNKKIFLLNPIPQMSYTDEIEAVQPVVINEDFSKIL